MVGPEGVPRCAKTPGMCHAIGDVCMMTADCCDGGSGACRDDRTGVLRCLPPASASCAGAGSGCAVGEQCCGGFCVADGSGALGCRDACLPLGAPCRANEDCCDGACAGPPASPVCVAASGAPAAGACTASGQACDPAQAACCAGAQCAVVSGGAAACAPVPE
jgi:hypothetical protein